MNHLTLGLFLLFSVCCGAYADPTQSAPEQSSTSEVESTPSDFQDTAPDESITTAQGEEQLSQQIIEFIDLFSVPSETDFHTFVAEKDTQYRQTSDIQLKRDRAKALLLYYFMIDDEAGVDKYATELRAISMKLDDKVHLAISNLYLGFNKEPSLDGVLAFVHDWQDELDNRVKKSSYTKIHTDLILAYAKLRPQIFPFEIQYLIQHLETIGEHPAFKLEKHVILWSLVARGWSIEQSLEYAQAFVNHAEQHILPVHKYIVLYNMAISLANRKYTQESIYLAQKYVALATLQNLPEELFYGYERLGEALGRNQQYEKANEAFKKAHPLEEHAGERWIAQINMIEAENYFYLNEVEKGKASLKKAEDYFRETNQDYRTVNNYINRVLAKKALTEGDTNAALDYYEDYIDNNRDAIQQQRLDNINGVKASMQVLIDHANESQQLSEQRLAYFQYISGVLVIVIIVIVAMAVRQKKTSKELKHKTVELRRLSRQDGLTKLFNRGHWENQTKEQFENLKRYEHYKATLVLFDIDDFKSINDTYGHVIGDAVIKKVAQIIKDQVREIDIAGRYGGEEFAVLFPHTGILDTLKVTERIRKEIEKSGIEFGSQKIDFTASFGLSEYKDTLNSPKDWINEADIALYASKQNGKNQCTPFE